MRLVQDPALFAGYQRGDPDALRTIYLHYAPQLYAYLRQGFSFSSGAQWYRVAGIADPVEQENLVQDTFVRCFEPKARASYDGQRPFYPYLQRICRNLFLGEKRKAWRVVLEDNPTSTAETEPAASAQDLLEHQELLHLLAGFLSQCTAREREVFRAIYEEGDSQQQAAERLGLGRTQVRTTLTKLRAELLTHLRSSGYLQHLQTNLPGLNAMMLVSPWLYQLLQDLLHS